MWAVYNSEILGSGCAQIKSFYLSILPSFSTLMRQYETIWHRLKNLPANEAEKVGVSVAAPRPLHGRIIKAVTKEKWKDLGYKILLDDKRAILSHSRQNAIITFYLSFTYGKEDF